MCFLSDTSLVIYCKVIKTNILSGKWYRVTGIKHNPSFEKIIEIL
jgi:hypothetical protein